MLMSIKINKILSRLGIKITKTKNLEEIYKTLMHSKKSSFTLEFLKLIDPKQIQRVFELLSFSNSQFHQDLMVLSELDFPFNGYFVEFGAHNGIELSNTLLLERKFDWSGILVEPCISSFQKIQINRESQALNYALHAKGGLQLDFIETTRSEISSLNKYISFDFHARERKSSVVRRYKVPTISLQELLELRQAPKVIDYLSIDTEGGEFEIIEHFDFTRYKFKVISIEHNFSENRDKIRNLLEKNGYFRKYDSLNVVDDFYVLSEL